MSEGKKFIIWRIIGNELPPLHAPGSGVSNLRFILQNESVFQHASKKYLLNRIIDSNVRKQMIAALEEFDADYQEIPFMVTPTCVSEDRVQALHAIIQNNQARNFVLEQSHESAQYILPLDGNCFFSEEGFEQLSQSVAAFEDRSNAKDYFAIPMMRLENNKQALTKTITISANDEPQVLFAANSCIRFNESIPYSKGEKVDLLCRLGRVPYWIKDYYTETPNPSQTPHTCVPNDAFCPDAGFVFRLFSGDVAASDSDGEQRRKERETAIENLLRLVKTSAVDV